MSLKNILGGRKAKASGDRFENMIVATAHVRGISILKIPSGAKWTRQGSKTVVIPMKSPFDFIAAFQGKTAFFDAKSTKEKTFSFSKIDRSQVKNLMTMAANGSTCGYLIVFLDESEIWGEAVWFTIFQVNAIKHGESLKPDMGKKLGKTTSVVQFNLEAIFDENSA